MRPTSRSRPGGSSGSLEETREAAARPRPGPSPARCHVLSNRGAAVALDSAGPSAPMAVTALPRPGTVPVPGCAGGLRHTPRRSSVPRRPTFRRRHQDRTGRGAAIDDASNAGDENVPSEFGVGPSIKYRSNRTDAVARAGLVGRRRRRCCSLRHGWSAFRPVPGRSAPVADRSARRATATAPVGRVRAGARIPSVPAGRGASPDGRLPRRHRPRLGSPSARSGSALTVVAAEAWSGRVLRSPASPS